MLKDFYNRPLKDFRISVTNKCNLNCIYCHHEGIHDKINGLNDIELTADEIISIVEVSTKFGIENVKLTGGEPLVRQDIYEIIQKISKIKAIKDISLVTNGTLLKNKAKKLAEAGLNRINVSLDTLDENLYQKIIRTKVKYSPNDIIEGIKASIKYGLTPIKINYLVLKGLNDKDLNEMIKLTCNLGSEVMLQVIELIPSDHPEIFNEFYVNFDEIEKKLSKLGDFTEFRALQKRKIYHLKNSCNVEVVRPNDNVEFCMNCHKIRLTSNGNLKTCLRRNDNLINLIHILRGNASNKEELIFESFQKALQIREPYCL
ncbi:MAG: GTP 3',8-cyclase MoaA [Candidatus Lokiarchaeota archaeon]|nr:GTP 3',8-cyclase MoaA [Candidatus Lokiarchaeota archaeon]